MLARGRTGRTHTMKTHLSSAVVVLAIAATTSCAKAECVSGVFQSCYPPAADVAEAKG